MIVLAIDTSEAFCSAALVDISEGSADTLGSLSEELGRGHAERLLPMLGEILEQSGKSYSDIERITVVTGPGTFTGLRIGLSVARGLSLALEVPAVGVTSLMALAATAGSEGTVHAFVKGRGGQVFFQSFLAVAEKAPKAITAPVNQDHDNILKGLEGASGLRVGSGTGEGAEIFSINAVSLAKLGAMLKPEEYPPEPTYFREADAVKAKPVIKLEKDVRE